MSRSGSTPNHNAEARGVSRPYRAAVNLSGVGIIIIIVAAQPPAVWVYLNFAFKIIPRLLDDSIQQTLLAANQVGYPTRTLFSARVMNLSLIDPFVLAQDYPDSLTGKLSTYLLTAISYLLASILGAKQTIRIRKWPRNMPSIQPQR